MEFVARMETLAISGIGIPDCVRPGGKSNYSFKCSATTSTTTTTSVATIPSEEPQHCGRRHPRSYNHYYNKIAVVAFRGASPRVRSGTLCVWNRSMFYTNDVTDHVGPAIFEEHPLGCRAMLRVHLYCGRPGVAATVAAKLVETRHWNELPHDTLPYSGSRSRDRRLPRYTTTYQYKTDIAQTQEDIHIARTNLGTSLSCQPPG
jgi:hypothetical protein